MEKIVAVRQIKPNKINKKNGPNDIVVKCNNLANKNTVKNTHNKNICNNKSKLYLQVKKIFCKNKTKSNIDIINDAKEKYKKENKDNKSNYKQKNKKCVKSKKGQNIKQKGDIEQIQQMSYVKDFFKKYGKLVGFMIGIYVLFVVVLVVVLVFALVLFGFDRLCSWLTGFLL